MFGYFGRLHKAGSAAASGEIRMLCVQTPRSPVLNSLRRPVALSSVPQPAGINNAHTGAVLSCAVLMLWL